MAELAFWWTKFCECAGCLRTFLGNNGKSKKNAFYLKVPSRHISRNCFFKPLNGDSWKNNSFLFRPFIPIRKTRRPKLGRMVCWKFYQQAQRYMDGYIFYNFQIKSFLWSFMLWFEMCVRVCVCACSYLCTFTCTRVHVYLRQIGAEG